MRRPLTTSGTVLFFESHKWRFFSRALFLDSLILACSTTISRNWQKRGIQRCCSVHGLITCAMSTPATGKQQGYLSGRLRSMRSRVPGYPVLDEAVFLVNHIKFPKLRYEKLGCPFSKSRWRDGLERSSKRMDAFLRSKKIYILLDGRTLLGVFIMIPDVYKKNCVVSNNALSNEALSNEAVFLVLQIKFQKLWRQRAFRFQRRAGRQPLRSRLEKEESRTVNRKWFENDWKTCWELYLSRGDVGEDHVCTCGIMMNKPSSDRPSSRI